ncbi:MAG: hypothetical protein JWN31_1415 [Frankiales bacterium]|nr:hypothetical protein [Frankiales bacterium]
MQGLQYEPRPSRLLAVTGNSSNSLRMPQSMHVFMALFTPLLYKPLDKLLGIGLKDVVDFIEQVVYV